jgi:hypothetical protein
LIVRTKVVPGAAEGGDHVGVGGLTELSGADRTLARSGIGTRKVGPKATTGQSSAAFSMKPDLP